MMGLFVSKTISTKSGHRLHNGAKWGVEYARASAESKSFDIPCVLYDLQQTEVSPKFCFSGRL
jgi:hypothetical protein